ncbi:MAG TPA: hypothetical protein VMN57_11040 [Anaerolineales bacterium]|nr:hypothetical protein [Anaerolineales bacterium]
MKNDRFLFGILIFIGVLVVTALVLFATGRSGQDYVADGSPEAAVHNYILALTREDYERAYGYLAAGEGKPSSVEFRTFFIRVDPHQNAGLRVGEAEMIEDEAVVDVTVVQGSSGPFDPGFDHPDTAVLQLEAGEWKIVMMPYPFWDFGWYAELPR